MRFAGFRLPESGGKSPKMIGSVVMLWLICIAVYGSRMFNAVVAESSVEGKIILSALGVIFLFFWLLGSYYTVILILSFFPEKKSFCGSETPNQNIPIAVLYPTCDDFQPESVLSCINQNYNNCHVFLLDDSNSDEFRDAVNKFHHSFREKTTIIRRNERSGFKAGNLNHALNQISEEYPYFVVVDADEKLPPDFIDRTLGVITNSEYDFVQANHRPNELQASSFSRDLSSTIIPFWQIHCSLRNRNGLVIFVGHGALIKTAAWKKAGGFPELITEDLAFSLELRCLGLKGYFLEDLICKEDFPENYMSFRKQQERYITGTTQVLHKYLIRVFRNKQISIIEKIDFVLWCLPLYVPALVFLILLFGGFGLFMVFGSWQKLEFTFQGNIYPLFTVRKINLSLDGLNTTDFKLFSIICSLSPIFASIFLGIRKKLNATRLILFSTVPYMSLMFVSWKSLISYFLFRRVSFAPTRGQSLNKELKNKLNIFIVSELIVAVFLCVVSILSLNLGYFAVSGCLIIGVLLLYIKWESVFLRFASVCCFIFILLQMLISLFTLIPSDSLLPMVFSVHF